MAYIAGVDKCSVAETDGISYNIYFSGCSLNCPGCHNPELQDENSGVWVSNEDVVKDIQENVELLDWICLMGGEPTYNVGHCISLLLALNEAFPTLKIRLYTGYNVVIEEIIELCDEIKYGPYKEELKTPNGPLASSNQRIVKGRRTTICKSE